MPRKSLPPDARSFADLYARGGVAHEAGDLTAAVELYSQALLRSRGVPPGDRAECLANRGRALSGLGERSRSMRDYRAALALAGDFHEVRARLANDLLLAGSRSAARPHILELLRHCPDWGETHRLHGDWLFLSESTRAAIPPTSGRFGSTPAHWTLCATWRLPAKARSRGPGCNVSRNRLDKEV